MPGSFLLLKYLHKFDVFSNVLYLGLRKYATSKGSFCQILEIFFDVDIVRVILPSKKERFISGSCFVLFGRNSQEVTCLNRLNKAGSRLVYGTKSKVRGVARNPVDHPHGGRTKTNQPEVSLWGWVAKKGK